MIEVIDLSVSNISKERGEYRRRKGFKQEN